MDGESFKVRSGEVFSPLGPNGAVKTTTVEVMECVRSPTAGQVRIHGDDTKKDIRSIEEHIGVMPQEFKAYDRSTISADRVPA